MKTTIAKIPNASQCKWLRFADEWDYETDCSHYLEDASEDSFEETGFVFCPFCGGEIEWEVLDNFGAKKV